MPSRSYKPCKYCNVATLNKSRYCDNHEYIPQSREAERKAKFEKTRPNATERGYDNRWRKYRAKFIKDHPVCNNCGMPAKVVDHIQAHKGNEHLFWDVNNHQALCLSCHSRKTARYDSNYLKGRK